MQMIPAPSTGARIAAILVPATPLRAIRESWFVTEHFGHTTLA
jgi:hypothetical protein